MLAFLTAGMVVFEALIVAVVRAVPPTQLFAGAGPAAPDALKAFSGSTGDVFDSHQESPWDDASRLAGAGGAIRDGHAMGFSERHRVELVACLATPERMLDGKRITDCSSEDFFTTDFWYMWCTTFAFEPWHSAIEFRRYLRRFADPATRSPTTTWSTPCC